MDRVFLEYYEDELTHLRSLSTEFSALHPAVARNLSLDTVPCPDPYVERLLEGVAFLSARTRLKVDAESSRFARNILDALYPDLVGPAPAVSTVVLNPGPQVQSMLSGHVVERGTRLISGLKEGLSTRCTYTTAQDVHLWPIRIETADFLQDRGALKAAGLSDADAEGAESGLRLVIARDGPGTLSELSLDGFDMHFCRSATSPAIFDALFGHHLRALSRPQQKTAKYAPTSDVEMVGLRDTEGLLPRSRPTFEGYRLLREYFLMPERFYYGRLGGLQTSVANCGDANLEIVILFDAECRSIADISAADFQLFATPVINLFEKECNIVDLDRRKSQQVLHADRTRPRDYEVYLVQNVEDAETEGLDAQIPPLFTLSQNRGTGIVYSTERRPRRPGEDEIRDGQTRTTYAGDDMFISISRPANARNRKGVRRLDVRALCTNRDLPILDDNPRLTLETGDPVSSITLLSAMKPPRPSLPASLPKSRGGESRLDDLSWRLIAQLQLNYLSLAEESKNAEPLRAMLDLYADRGDPALARHIRSIQKITSQPVVERLEIEGPMCFGHGVEITLHVDENTLTGNSSLLLSALLNQIFARHVGLNSFVRTRTKLLTNQEEIQWPMMPGLRHLI